MDAEQVPAHCPGPESVSAGKESACQGCPNRKICSSGQGAVGDPDAEVIADKLANVKRKILVLSGKGGVGKSTVTSTIARALATDSELNVAIMDADICGPSVPIMMGLEGEQVHQSGAGWSPVFVEDNLAVMSVGFLLGSADDAVIWRGPRKNGLIKQFLRDVDWGELDYLLVDTPPGTSDEHLSIVQLLKLAGIDGAIIVTTPQEISLLDVRKEIGFCQKVNVPLIGVIENMSGYVCPKCNLESTPFAATTGGGQQMALDVGIPFLGKIPLDPRLGRCCDEGKNFMTDHSDSAAAMAYKDITFKVIQYCDNIKAQK